MEAIANLINCWYFGSFKILQWWWTRWSPHSYRIENVIHFTLIFTSSCVIRFFTNADRGIARTLGFWDGNWHFPDKLATSWLVQVSPLLCWTYLWSLRYKQYWCSYPNCVLHQSRGHIFSYLPGHIFYPLSKMYTFLTAYFMIDKSERALISQRSGQELAS